MPCNDVTVTSCGRLASQFSPTRYHTTSRHGVTMQKTVT